MFESSAHTIVVGAGWTGLAAALTLTRQGHKVILLEAAPQAGGRARSIPFGSDTVDNGQHLFMGAYTEILSLLKWLNIPENAVFDRKPFEWFMLNLQGAQKTIYLKAPSRMSLLKGCLSFLKIQGFSLKERLSAIAFYRTIYHQNFYLSQDSSVYELLLNFKQPISLMEKLWGPMALAALSTPIHQASAQVFVKILRDIFKKSIKQDDTGSPSNWLFPKVDLSALLPNPIIKYIKENGSFIFYNQRVQGLIIENGVCKGVQTATRTFYSKSIILATPPHVAAKLLLSNSEATDFCKKLITNLLKFHYQPITTVYLRYANAINLKKPMIGFINSTLHWMFDRRFAGQPDILSIVITGSGAHTLLPHVELVTKIQQEIRSVCSNLQVLPTLHTTPIDYRVVTEKRAAFSCDVGINNYRPQASTPLANLWLAGDYIEPCYPATLEGAIRSGIKAAQLILSRDALFI
ncbi:MAG TPA: hydroxysqualene dehydroxylase HpnE [Gammaproteobacteria bacterium]|nr:hydroxysqualene dehydroxylase HpnE [Gammaproteobacteria bacterium]